MAFRGFGDDALKVKADQREAQIKREQIAASERASQRAAGVQVASLNENARQADMANERAGAQLAAGETARADEMRLKREGMAQSADLTRESMAQDLTLKSEQLALGEVGRQDDLNVKLADLSQRERQIKLNEDTAARLDSEWQKQQAAEKELQDQDTATQLSVIRAAGLSSGPLGMPYINALNNIRGVAYGDPGSTTQVFPVIDPKTGARLGIGTVKIGQDGKEIQSILDPATILPKVRASMSPDKWEEYAQQLITGNKAKGSDRFTAAAMKEMQEHNRLKLAATDPGTLLKTVKELGEDIGAAKEGAGKAADPANQAALDDTRTIQSNVLKTLREQSAGATEEAPALELSPEQQAFWDEPPPGGTATTGKQPTQAELDNLNTQVLAAAKGDKKKARELFIAEYIKKFGAAPEGAKPEQSKEAPSKSAEPPATPAAEKKGMAQTPSVEKTEAEKLAEAAPTKEELADPAYWRDMPTRADDGKKRDKPSVEKTEAEKPEKDIKQSRKDILGRLEAAYRLPKTSDKAETVRKIKAELDAFNEKYPV